MTPVTRAHYFAYGADMDPEDLGLRCEMRRRQRVRFARSTPAILDGFRLVCNIPSNYRRGSIFNIVPDAADAVHGVIYEMHPGDSLSAAMIKEGESTSYLLALQNVRTPNGKVLPALVLRAEAKSKPLPPTPDYLAVVVKAAKRHGLPAAWIERLHGIGKST